MFFFSAMMLVGALTFGFSPQTLQTKAMQDGDNGAKTVLNGVYTADQAAKGEAEYESNCVRCHDGSNADGPSLVGRPFIDRWREDNLDVLFNYIETKMPADSTAKLSDSTYLNILAYILRANTFPDGAKELTADVLGSIRLVGKDGPKPLPANTLVQVVGCLAQSSNNAWTLTNASEPIRTRDGKETTAEDLKRSEARPLGTQTFRLQNFTNVRFDFSPDPYKGHKVQIKGVLIRQPYNDRINVTLLNTVASTCAH